ncbi:protein ORF104 [Lake sturgeon herpesvirus]|nr:protein ORF104 [Lake sturgeon herpesvirus]
MDPFNLERLLEIEQRLEGLDAELVILQNRDLLLQQALIILDEEEDEEEEDEEDEEEFYTEKTRGG